MRKAFIVVLFVIAAFLFYSIATHESTPAQMETYRFDFNEMDKDFWLVSEWETFKRAYDLVKIEDGVLKLSSDTTGVMPYLLSKPLELQSKDVLTIKRRVKISHGNDTFAGGLALYQTTDLDLVPDRTDGSWFTAIGDGIMLLEYSYDLQYESERPGRDVIRFLAADWEYNNNYQLITPIYDEWIDETLIFDMRSNQMIYKLNDKEYKLYSYKLDKSAVRIMMHPYGTGTGNSIDIDYVEVTIEDKSSRR
jgi:hypothetical protein